MHNKRIGRDDLLKIEVRTLWELGHPAKFTSSLYLYSGLGLLRLPHGDTRLAVAVVIVVIELLHAAVPAHHLLAAVTIHLARTTDVTATVIGNETVIETMMTAAALEALSTETETET